MASKVQQSPEDVAAKAMKDWPQQPGMPDDAADIAAMEAWDDKYVMDIDDDLEREASGMAADNLEQLIQEPALEAFDQAVSQGAQVSDQSSVGAGLEDNFMLQAGTGANRWP